MADGRVCERVVGFSLNMEYEIAGLGIFINSFNPKTLHRVLNGNLQQHSEARFCVSLRTHSPLA